MNQIDNIHLQREIELLREKLHRQKDFAGRDTLQLSLKLDRLILMAMKRGNNGS